MAPKKAPEIQTVVVVAPPDPEIVKEQGKLDKWSTRAQQIQHRIDAVVKHIAALESQRVISEQQLIKVSEQANEIVTKKVPALFAPPPVVQAPVAPAAATAKVVAAPLPSKSPRGKADPAPAPVVEATAPPPPPPPDPKDIEMEERKKTKVTNALSNLFKKKRASQQQSPKENDAASAAGGPTADAASGTTLESPRAVESFQKPNDVPAELWSNMLALREERLTTEEKISTLKTAIEKGKVHLQTLKNMESVSVYSTSGAERELKLATARTEERKLREQAAREAAAKEAAAAASAQSPLLKKK